VVALYGSLLLTCAWLQLRKRGSDLVVGMWMLSWGSRGRRFKVGGQRQRPRLQSGLHFAAVAVAVAFMTACASSLTCEASPYKPDWPTQLKLLIAASNSATRRTGPATG